MTALSGEVSLAYGDDFSLSAVTVDQVQTSYLYDDDGVLTQAGELEVIPEDADSSRQPQLKSGRVWKTRLGSDPLTRVETVQTYTAFGEVESFQAKKGSTVLYETANVYDGLGRLSQNTETIGGTAHVYEYEYDDAGRLWTVTRDGSSVESYTYDDNGNREYVTRAGAATLEGVSNDRDQLVCYAEDTSPCDGLLFSYTLNGELETRTEVGSGDETSYRYDGLGNLREVEQPDGTRILYAIDGLNRRVAKLVEAPGQAAVVVKRWVYLDGLRIGAEIEVVNNVTTTTRFIYGTRANVPDYMERGGVAYRIISDHQGSPRLVVDTSTGAVVRRMEYDVFGRVMDDPGNGIEHGGYIPFGFAGGLYDPDTGLVRFGARDYDPETGRWTAKDPIGFAGGDTNLYGYVLNDPVNWIDPLVFILKPLYCRSATINHPLDRVPHASDDSGHAGIRGADGGLKPPEPDGGPCSACASSALASCPGCSRTHVSIFSLTDCR